MATHEQILRGRAKVDKALDLRLHGMAWREVAKQVGYSDHTTACRAVTNHLAKHPVESADAYRAQEAMKLDLLEVAAWQILRKVHWATCSRGLVLDSDDMPVTDDAPRNQAIRTLVMIHDRRVRLLGLALQPSVPGEDATIDAEIEELVASLTATSPPASLHELPA